MPLSPAQPRLSPRQISLHAQNHVTTDELTFAAIERDKPFVCPTITPLYYCDVYRELPTAAQVRYCQLMGLFTNEVITFFESHFAAAVLGALLRTRFRPLDQQMRANLENFMAEEARHVIMWRELNRRAQPQWYAGGDFHLLRLSAPLRAATRLLAVNPAAFPVVLWLMLLQEERSMDMGRRCTRAGDAIEPTFRSAYRAHMEEEVRHVQIDWHLIERYYRDRGRLVRKMTAATLRMLLGGFLLVPRRSALLIDVLVSEQPTIAPLRPRMLRELSALAHNDAYQHMMYSRDSTPISFALMDRFPEFRGVSRVLRGYRPGEAA